MLNEALTKLHIWINYKLKYCKYSKINLKPPTHFIAREAEEFAYGQEIAILLAENTRLEDADGFFQFLLKKQAEGGLGDKRALNMVISSYGRIISIVVPLKSLGIIIPPGFLSFKP